MWTVQLGNTDPEGTKFPRVKRDDSQEKEAQKK